MTTLSPGQVIGILGGGQLGRMAAQAAARLGYRCHIYCPDKNSPASQVTSLSTIAAYDDWQALRDFAGAVDVITFEFENIPYETGAFLGEASLLRPSCEVLAICQDRTKEKTFLRNTGIATADFEIVSEASALVPAVHRLGKPGVLKTATLGYDGKGQARISPEVEDPLYVWQSATRTTSQRDCILEAFVDFRMEISVIVARGQDGATVSFEPVQNRHENHILRTTVVPAPLSAELLSHAETIARQVAESLDLVGLLAVEMFVTKDDEILVNELAPRPHNSGHWTLDACRTSQFEQFVRAVAGLPLGSANRLAEARMVNLLGDESLNWRQILADPNAKLHLYGKAEARPGRKMGHVTYLRKD